MYYAVRIRLPPVTLDNNTELKSMEECAALDSSNHRLGSELGVDIQIMAAYTRLKQVNQAGTRRFLHIRLTSSAKSECKDQKRNC